MVKKLKEVLIYPYSKPYETFICHQGLLDDMVIVEVISPRGWGMENDSISSGTSEITVKCDFSKGLKNCNIVWFVDDEHIELPEQILWERLSEAILEHKKIIYTRYKNKKQYKKAMQYIPKDLKFSTSKKMQKEYWDLKNICYNINTPVLIVFGIDEYTEKFEVQVSLREKFISKGYKVSSITSRRDSELLGMNSIPAFMFEDTINVSDKIIQYNHYVKYIEQIEKPELIIIGVPGGILPYDKFNYNHYGIIAYEISYAVPCDLSIMCTHYNTNFTGDYSDLKKDIENKFGFNIIYCHIAAVTLNPITNVDNEKRKFVNIRRKLVQSKLQHYSKKDIIDFTKEADLDFAVNNIIDNLSEDYIIRQ